VQAHRVVRLAPFQYVALVIYKITAYKLRVNLSELVGGPALPVGLRIDFAFLVDVCNKEKPIFVLVNVEFR